MDPPQAPTSCSGRYTCTNGRYTRPSPAQKPCPNLHPPPCDPCGLMQVYSVGEYNLYEHATRERAGGRTWVDVRRVWGSNR